MFCGTLKDEFGTQTFTDCVFNQSIHYDILTYQMCLKLWSALLVQAMVEFEDETCGTYRDP